MFQSYHLHSDSISGNPYIDTSSRSISHPDHHGESRYTISTLAKAYTALTDMSSSCLGSIWRDWPGPGSIAPTVFSALTVYLQPLSLLLKASPTIDELSLYDVVNTPGVTADLSHISSIAVRNSPIIGSPRSDSWQKITGYLPADDGLKKALTGADVVVIPAGIPRTRISHAATGKQV